MLVLRWACAWCDSTLRGLESAPPSNTSHGVCPICSDALIFDLEPGHTDPVWALWVVLGGEG